MPARPPDEPAEQAAADAAEDARTAREEARQAREEAREVREEAREAVRDAVAEAVAPMDAVDMATLREQAGVDEANPFGRMGRPLARLHPFRLGFLAALGALTAWTLYRSIASVSQVVMLVLISLFLAVGLSPIVGGLQTRGLSRRTAILVVVLAVLGLFTLFTVQLVPPLVAQTTDFVDNLPEILDSLRTNRTIQDFDEQYGVIERLQSYVSSGAIGGQVAGGILGVGRFVFGAAFSAFTVLVLTLYFLGSLPRMVSYGLRLVPASRRPRVALLTNEVITRIGGYVAGQLAVAGTAGVVAFVFLSVAGIPYALPLAVIVAFFDLIPQVGATLGGAVLTLVGLFQGLGTGLAALAFVLVYQQFENYVLYPRVMRRAVDVAPAVTIVAALVGGALLGFVGALMAIPTAASIQLLLEQVVMPRQERT